jgi:hypothetical protein
MHVYPLRSKSGLRTPTTVAGWPDLWCWHERRPERGFIALELKVRPNTATEAQTGVLASLEAAGARTMVAYPEQLDDVQRLFATARR